MKRIHGGKNGRKPARKSGQAAPIRTTVPPHHLRQLIAKLQKRSAEHRHRVYPHPETGEHQPHLLGIPDLRIEQLSFVDVEPDPSVDKKQGGKGGSGKGGGGRQQQASPQVVLAEVQKAFAGVSAVGHNGPLVFGEFNAEFGNASKANFYATSYAEIVKRHHLLFCEEVDFNFLQTVGKANSYGYFCCKANSRGQAVGFLVHPRLRVIGQPTEYSQVANVQGIPDLRPAYRLDLEDKTTGYKFSVVVVHLKSMRGGPKVTAPVRYQQCQIIAQVLGSSKEIILAGDFNTFLNNTTDTQPLTQAGFKLVFPGDNTSTQSMGGRLDGFFTYQLTAKLGFYQIRNWWKNKKLGRSLSDHGLLSLRTVKLQPCVPGSADPDCQPGAGDGQPGGDGQGKDVPTE